MQKSAAAAAAVVVGAVGGHINEILFAHHRFDHIPQVLRHRISEALAHQLTGVLHGEFDAQILVPVGIDLQFALPDPLGVVLDDAFDFKVVVDFVFLQSDPDCEQFVPSFGIEPDLAPEIFDGFGLGAHNFLPVFIIRHEHTVVFCCPSCTGVGPVCTHNIKNLP